MLPEPSFRRVNESCGRLGFEILEGRFCIPDSRCDEELDIVGKGWGGRVVVDSRGNEEAASEFEISVGRKPSATVRSLKS